MVLLLYFILNNAVLVASLLGMALLWRRMHACEHPPWYHLPAHLQPHAPVITCAHDWLQASPAEVEAWLYAQGLMLLYQGATFGEVQVHVWRARASLLVLRRLAYEQAPTIRLDGAA